MRHRVLVVAATVSSLLVGGCATSQTASPVEKLGQRDMLVGTAVGAGAGALGGYALSQAFDWDPTTATLVGAGIGAGTGLVVGKVVADRREAYATEKEFLDSEIAAADKTITKKSAELAKLEADLEATRKEVDALVAQDAKNVDVSKEAGRKVAELNKVIENNNATLNQYKDSIDYLNAAIASNESASAQTTAQTEDLTAERAELAKRRGDLESQYAQLNEINKATDNEARRLLALLD